MKIGELKELMAKLPAEYDDKEVVIREIGKFEEPSNEGMWFKKDMPICFAYYDESTGELAFCDEENYKRHKEFELNENLKEGFMNYSEFERRKKS